ncbi:PQQ-binding-like beta-propeller repeat protein [Gemmatimonadota bacterium]
MSIFPGCDGSPTDQHQEDRLLWRTRIPFPIYYSSPGLGSDGTIYIASRGDSLRAFSPDGSINWSIYVHQQPDHTTSPVIADDGTIYFSSIYLFALNPDGSLKWRHYLEETRGSPAIGPDGTVYVIALNQLLAITPEGSLDWEKTILPISAPVTGPDGTIYCGTIGLSPDEYYLDALNPDGDIQWRFPVSSFVSSPAVNENGTLYFVSADTLFAVSDQGSMEWSVPLNVPVERRVSPSIGLNGTVYIGTSGTGEDGHLSAFSAQGDLLWNYSTSAKVITTPAVGDDGSIYFGCHDGYLYALDDAGSLSWRYDSGSWIGSSPAIADDGTLYFGSSQYFLYALRTGSLGLADTAWPKFRANNQNTGGY